MDCVSAGIQSNPDFLVINRSVSIFGDCFNRLQIFVVHRIFGNLTVKFRSFHFFAKKRKLTVIEQNRFIVNGEDRVFISADMHRVTQRKVIFLFRLRRRI